MGIVSDQTRDVPTAEQRCGRVALACQRAQKTRDPLDSAIIPRATENLGAPVAEFRRGAGTKLSAQGVCDAASDRSRTRSHVDNRGILSRLERTPDSEAGLGDLRSQISQHSLVGGTDPGIEAAADDLFNAAAAVVRVVDDGDSRIRHKRIMNEANLRFRERLVTAMPSQQALKLGLTAATAR